MRTALFFPALLAATLTTFAAGPGAGLPPATPDTQEAYEPLSAGGQDLTTKKLDDAGLDEGETIVEIASPRVASSDLLGALRAALTPAPVEKDDRLPKEWLTPAALEAMTVMALRTRCQDPRVTAQTAERAAAVIHGIAIPELTQKGGPAQAVAFLQIHHRQNLRRLVDREVAALEMDCVELAEFQAGDIQKISKAGASIVSSASALVASTSIYSQALAYPGGADALPRPLRQALDDLVQAAELVLKQDATRKAEQEREQAEHAARALHAKEAAARPPVRVFKDGDVFQPPSSSPRATVY